MNAQFIHGFCLHAYFCVNITIIMYDVTIPDVGGFCLVFFISILFSIELHMTLKNLLVHHEKVSSLLGFASISLAWGQKANI